MIFALVVIFLLPSAANAEASPSPLTSYFEKIIASLTDLADSLNIQLTNIKNQNMLSQTVAAIPLKIGSTGANVKTLQTLLSQNASTGYPGNLITGYFGTITQSAIRTVQLQNKLPITGVADGQTVSFIVKKNSSSPIFVDEPADPIISEPPSWCEPPNIFSPIEEGQPGAPGMCIKPGKMEKGEQQMRICFRDSYWGVFCYNVRIRCKASDQPCEIKISLPVFSPLPSAKCVPLPRQPHDPPGIHRTSCTFGEITFEKCYSVDPKELNIIEEKCPVANNNTVR